MKQAMILAAGLGTRLKPLTDTCPKALVEVGDKTLLEIVITNLIRNGFTSVVVNVHHYASQIIDFLHANNNFGIDIKISDESGLLLETGGAIKKASNLFSSDVPILIHNVDILSNLDLSTFYEQSFDNPATLMVSSRETSRYLLVDNDNILRGWVNTKTNEVKGLNSPDFVRVAFSGIHSFSPTLFPFFDQWPECFSIIDFYLTICEKKDIKCILNPDLRLLDVGKLTALPVAEQFLSQISK